MKTSTIVNASNVNNKFNSAIEAVVNGSVEATEYGYMDASIGQDLYVVA